MIRNNSSLKTQISAIAGRFATQLTNDILMAVRGCTVNDIVSLGGTITLTPADVPVPYVPTEKATAKATRKAPATRRNRLTGQDVIKTAGHVILYVGKNPNVGAAQIQGALKIAKNQWLRVITAAQDSGLKKKGEKRSTVYYVGVYTKPGTAKKAIKAIKAAGVKTHKGTARVAKNTQNVNNATLTATSDIATPATLTPDHTPDVWPGDAQVTNGAAVEATA